MSGTNPKNILTFSLTVRLLLLLISFTRTPTDVKKQHTNTLPMEFWVMQKMKSEREHRKQAGQRFLHCPAFLDTSSAKQMLHHNHWRRIETHLRTSAAVFTSLCLSFIYNMQAGESHQVCQDHARLQNTTKDREYILHKENGLSFMTIIHIYLTP